MPNKVFISYRREDSRYQARRVYDAFVHALPPDTVFMDVDSIPPGADFVEILEGWVEQCDVLLALIGPNWLNSIDPRTGLRRLDSLEDFVRIEVRGALQRKIPVVPVLLDATEMPTAADLPDDIKALRRRHAEFVDFRTFDSDVQRLIKRLKLGKKNEAADKHAGNDIVRRTVVAAKTFFQRIKPDVVTAKLLLSAAALASLLLAAGAAGYLMSAATNVDNAGTQVDASAATADFARSEEGRRTAEARASQATDALAIAVKARQEAEAAATAAAAAQARSEEGRRAAETRAGEATDTLAKTEKARSDAEAKATAAAAALVKAEGNWGVAESRANNAVDSLKKSDKARVDAEARATSAANAQAKAEEGQRAAEATVAALIKAEESRKTAAPSAASPPPGPRPTAGPQPSSSRKLLTDLGHRSAWALGGALNCNFPKDANFLSLDVGDTTIIWTNGLGSLDVETIVASYENAFHTSTSRSSHVTGPNEKLGQTWAYSRNGDGMLVQPSGRSAMTLTRCP